MLVLRESKVREMGAVLARGILARIFFFFTTPYIGLFPSVN